MIKIYDEAIESVKQFGVKLFYNNVYTTKLNLFEKFNITKNLL